MQRGDKRLIERGGVPAAQGRDELEIRLDRHAAAKLAAIEALANRLVSARRGRVRCGVDRGIVRELCDPAEEPDRVVRPLRQPGAAEDARDGAPVDWHRGGGRPG